MQMNVKGSYANILAFLDGITRMDREIKFTNLSISTLKNVATNSERGSGDTPPELQMTISLQAQYYGIPVEADATTQ
jgi:Tfp pilus assembly protein PilO